MTVMLLLHVEDGWIVVEMVVIIITAIQLVVMAGSFMMDAILFQWW